ncbi:MAG: hypothetical protein GF421_03880 [Candidatus Aminicenantes bacterium]|nr:hypothetical protein [Candidatus Aminicenantes bacterium]
MSVKRRRLFLFTLLGALSLFFLLEGNLLKTPPSSLGSDDSFVVLARALNLIKNEYIQEPSPGTTLQGAFRGMVNSLDIRSSYLDPKNTDKYKKLWGKLAYETGLVLYKTPTSFPVVIGIKENSPAEQAELELGDTIGAINGQLTLEMSMLESNLWQKNETADLISIKILNRTGDQEISINRELISDSFFSFNPHQGPGGILKIYALFPPCIEEIKKKVVPQLSSQKEPLVIDLRCCHDGTLNEAKNLINIFLQKKNIGYLKTKETKKQVLHCLDLALLPEIPLFVWTNQSTIGASEAAASILKKYREAKVIGKKTLGLMSDETLVSLNDGSGVVLTSVIFHPYSKAESWKHGINPDVPLKGTDLHLNAYLEATQKTLSEQ